MILCTVSEAVGAGLVIKKSFLSYELFLLQQSTITNMLHLNKLIKVDTIFYFKIHACNLLLFFIHYYPIKYKSSVSGGLRETKAAI